MSVHESIELDWTDYVDTRGCRVPEGQYTVRVTSIEQKESVATGNPYCQLALEIVVGPEKGQTFIDRLMIMKTGMWRWDMFLPAVGIQRTKGKMNLRFGDILGKTLKVTVADDEYNGTTRSQVVAYDAAAAPAVKTAAPDPIVVAATPPVAAAPAAASQPTEAEFVETAPAEVAATRPVMTNPWTGQVEDASSIAAPAVAL